MRRRLYSAPAAIMTLFILSVPVFAASEEGAAKGVAEIADPVEGWYELWNEMLWDITIMGVIFALITLYFMWRYRRKFPQQEGNQVKLTFAGMMLWALVPTFIFLADDLYLAGKTWALYNTYRTVPENSLEIKLESSMWSWGFTYPNGVQATNVLRVPAGRPIVMRMKSLDVIHSFFLPDFRVKEDSMPGRVTYLWFYPREPGKHVITCAEYCGVLHSSMRGTLIIMPVEEFNTWLAKEKANL